jgi:hypothetical protein
MKDMYVYLVSYSSRLEAPYYLTDQRCVTQTHRFFFGIIQFSIYNFLFNSILFLCTKTGENGTHSVVYADFFQ